MNRSQWKRISVIALVVVLSLAFLWYLKSRGLLQVSVIREFIEGFGIWAPLVYILFYIVVTLVGVSAAAFTVLAGTLFGWWEGLLIVVTGATISATIAFFIARYVRKGFRDDKKHKKGYVQDLVQKIEDAGEKRGFVIIALLRLSFLPYIPLSYAAGLVSSLKARDFILATLITNVFGSFFFIVLGAAIAKNIAYVALAILALLLFLQMPKAIKWYRSRKEERNHET